MTRCILILLALVVVPFSWSYDYDAYFEADDPETWPVIALIIDDIGNLKREGRRAVSLPGPVAFAVLPKTPYGPELASAAHEVGKEILLHQPFQATEQNHLLGDGAILLDQSYDDVRRTLKENLADVPHVAGLNNHMGSLLTRHPGHMRWLMALLQEEGNLFFVDSRTTGSSVAFHTAGQFQLPRLRRDVFLDSDQSYEAIAGQFERLKQHARKHGFAVGIGHPFPETLDVLEKELPRLSGLGYRLVSIQSMIEIQSRQRDVDQRQVWPAPDNTSTDVSVN